MMQHAIENCFFFFFVWFSNILLSLLRIILYTYRLEYISPVRSVSSTTSTVSHPSAGADSTAAAASFRPTRVL